MCVCHVCVYILIYCIHYIYICPASWPPTACLDEQRFDRKLKIVSCQFFESHTLTLPYILPHNIMENTSWILNPCNFSALPPSPIRMSPGICCWPRCVQTFRHGAKPGVSGLAPSTHDIHGDPCILREQTVLGQQGDIPWSLTWNCTN